MPLLRPAIVLFLILSLVTGVLYPFAVTGLAQLLFPDQAAGSLIVQNGQPIGSRLLGQSFTDPKYFWSRPSATAPQPYNGLASGGSNQGPLNPALIEAIKARIAVLRSADPTNTAPIPVDLVTASASGLDPDISLAAAYYQAPRIARLRGLDLQQLHKLIASRQQGRLLGILGEPRINVLELNLALERERLTNRPSPDRARHGCRARSPQGNPICVTRPAREECIEIQAGRCEKTGFTAFRRGAVC